jgi:hypothetical protein
MTIQERTALLEASIAEDPDDPRSRRYALRRTPGGLEFFEAKFTCVGESGDDEFHGHPTDVVSGKVLREFRDRGLISAAEYNWLRKELG